MPEVTAQSTTMQSGKRLNEMNRLADMAQFPAVVNLGASVNVVAMVTLVWLLEPRYPQQIAPIVFLVAVLAANLIPVVLLRRTIGPATVYPEIARMNFWRDQHKFSDWVYVVASANMAFWVLGSWVVFAYVHTALSYAMVFAVAFLATYSPALRRAFGGDDQVMDQVL